ncbi:MAG TPA: response regulator [Rhodanobacteraceae bacterium]|nr:response regulator [Rhodanobacteraceae bacterium]
MIDVVVVDDHELVRVGFRLILEGAGDIKVTGEAGEAESGLRLIRELQPAVALVDVHLPGYSGLELTERLRRADVKTQVVVLTAIENSGLPRRLLEAGALGYLTKACAAEELLRAVRAVAEGKRYLAPSVAQQLALDSLSGHASPFDTVSARELEVALMLVRGELVKDIGARLNLSPKTVSTYKQRLFDKLGIDNNIALAHLINAYGLNESGVPIALPEAASHG